MQAEATMATTRQPTTLVERIDCAVRPVLAAEGYDLVLVELGAPGQTLRIYIDRLDTTDSVSPPSAGEGITLDDCTRASHLVSDLLDAEGLSDKMDGAFSLEVSSPGLDRPLVRARDFCRFLLREVRIITHQAVDASGRRKFKGVLVGADRDDHGGIEIEVDGERHTLSYGLISQARLIPTFET